MLPVKLAMLDHLNGVLIRLTTPLAPLAPFLAYVLASAGIWAMFNPHPAMLNPAPDPTLSKDRSPSIGPPDPMYPSTIPSPVSGVGSSIAGEAGSPASGLEGIPALLAASGFPVSSAYRIVAGVSADGTRGVR